MKRLVPLLALLLLGAAPVRDNTYITGTEIEPDDVLDNENAIYEYLQDGVDTYAANSITTTAIATGAVTSNDILDGTITTADLSFSITSGTLLPSGAVYFLLTGSCPSGTTDISATYEGDFLRVSATQLTTGGDTTHTHGVGSFVTGSTHTHTIPRDGWGATDVGTSGRLATAEDSGAGNALATATADNTSGASGGSVAVSGTSATGSSLPPFTSAKLCRVN